MKKILIAGVWDITHAGHFNILYEASKIGKVYVAVLSDDWAKSSKQINIIYDENFRKLMLESIRIVEKVIIIKESNWKAKSVDFIMENNIEVLGYGNDHDVDGFIGKEFSEEIGIPIVFFERTPNISSSYIRNYLKNKKFTN